MIRLICTDFDQTVFDAEGQGGIARPLVRWLRAARKRGARWLICSGREYPELIVNELLKTRCVMPDFIVTGEREIYELDHDRFVPHVQWNQKCRSEHEDFFRRARETFNRISNWVKSRALGELSANALSPLNIQAATDADASRVHTFLGRQCELEPDLEIARNANFFRLSYRGYNKGILLSQIASCLEIDRQEIFAAGDHYNDLTMLDGSRAAMIAAPSNAIVEVKAAVQRLGGYVARQPLGFGVLEALEHYSDHRRFGCE